MIWISKVNVTREKKLSDFQFLGSFGVRSIWKMKRYMFHKISESEDYLMILSENLIWV